MAADGAGSSVKKVCMSCNAEFQGDITNCPNDGTALTSLAQGNLIGTVLGGRYEILDVIGDGAMGRVYLAKHQLMKRQVAVKMMHPQLISGKAALKRFQKEAELASALNHPNILSVYDFGVTDDSNPYLVMDFLKGRELLDVLREEKHLPVKKAFHIFKQVCTGLAHAHEKGVVHRDLKPSNIMLITLDHDDSFVKILDFGIAKQLNPSESAASNLTRTGEVFGTPHYMSPEQCRALEVDARADIYAVGCVLYQTLTGELPIRGADLIECLYKHVNETPPSFSSVCPELDLSPEVEAVVFKAMAKKPEDRFQTMAEMKAAMDIIEPDMYTGTYSRVDLPAIKLDDSGKIQLVGNKAAEEKTAEEKLSEQKLSDTTADEDNAVSQSPADKLTESGSNSDVSSKIAPPQEISVGGTVLTTPPGQTVTARARAVQDMDSKKKLIIGVSAAVIVISLGIGLFSGGGNSIVKMRIAKLHSDALKKYEQGDYAAAKKITREAIKVEDDNRLPRGYRCLYILGQIQYGQGDYEDGEANLERSYDIVRKLEPGTLHMAEVGIALGRARAALKDYKAAEPLLTEGYDIRKRELKPDDVLIADALAGLADLNMRQSRSKEALEELNQALVILKKQKGEYSIEVATAENNLGQAYQLVGEFKKAEELYQKALTLRLSKLPADSPLIADSLQCLGALYEGLGRYDDALNAFRQAKTILEKSMTTSDPRLARALQQYSALQEKMLKHR